MSVDYKELLAKYISHVGCEEGINFISRINEDGSCDYSKAVFSPEEKEALEECEQMSCRFDGG